MPHQRGHAGPPPSIVTANTPGAIKVPGGKAGGFQYVLPPAQPKPIVSTVFKPAPGLLYNPQTAQQFLPGQSIQFTRTQTGAGRSQQTTDVLSDQTLRSGYAPQIGHIRLRAKSARRVERAGGDNPFFVPTGGGGVSGRSRRNPFLTETGTPSPDLIGLNIPV